MWIHAYYVPINCPVALDVPARIAISRYLHLPSPPECSATAKTWRKHGKNKLNLAGNASFYGTYVCNESTIYATCSYRLELWWRSRNLWFCGSKHTSNFLSSYMNHLYAIVLYSRLFAETIAICQLFLQWFDLCKWFSALKRETVSYLYLSGVFLLCLAHISVTECFGTLCGEG